MKQIFTLAFLLTISIIASAKTPITLTTWWGNWNANSSWDLNRIPKNGDSVIIPAGKGVVMNADIDINNLSVNILGTLALEKKMTLGNPSVIKIGTTGRLYAWNANRLNELITIGGVRKFDQTTSFNVYGISVANRNSGVAPNGFAPLSALPVTFSSFNATKNDNAVVLTWTTANEFNNNNFEIEKSTDGLNYNVIAVMMGAGTSSTSSSYKFTDKNISNSVVYYRLRQVDIDGNSKYSVVKTISGNGKVADAKIYAANKQINIELNNEVKGNLSVRVVSMSGQVVAQKNYQNASYKINLAINNQNNGAFIVQLTDGKGWSTSSKVML
ncbi:MAG: T9SS type A sorting domain-containing protein [Gemmatimonadaceae bacterium]|nr:T9SS type A sorting domain-containing protein [Chitinophagaceae bacterium]